jgi:hypothetical protein
MVKKKNQTAGEGIGSFIGKASGNAFGKTTGIKTKEGGKIGGRVGKNLEKGKKIGSVLASAAGGVIGHAAGKALKHITGIDEKAGKAVGKRVGAALGDLLPFKLGGKINKDGPIYAHHGEFVLPAGVHPDSHQLKIVKKKGGLEKKEAVGAKQAYPTHKGGGKLANTTIKGMKGGNQSNPKEKWTNGMPPRNPYK